MHQLVMTRVAVHGAINPKTNPFSPNEYTIIVKNVDKLGPVICMGHYVTCDNFHDGVPVGPENRCAILQWDHGPHPTQPSEKP